MVTKYLCPNKKCNPMFPLFGKVYMGKGRVEDKGTLYCSKCKAHFDEGLIDKKQHKKVCGGELKQAYIYVWVCDNCSKEQ